MCLLFGLLVGCGWCLFGVLVGLELLVFTLWFVVVCFALVWGWMFVYRWFGGWVGVTSRVVLVMCSLVVVWLLCVFVGRYFWWVNSVG